MFPKFILQTLTFTEVSSLNHEVFHNPMEQTSFVMERFKGAFTDAFLTCSENINDDL